MAGKTDQTKLQFLFKKALGFANTSNLKGETEETAGSVWQLGSNLVFGENVPADPTASAAQLNKIQGGNIEYVHLKMFKIAGSTYDANDTGGGGDGAQSSGPHAYGLYLPSSYQADSENPKKGTGKFINNLALSSSDGGLQLVGPNFSSTSPNPYQLTLYKDDAGSIGDQISLTDEVDWMVDYYNGIVFLQDYDASTIPAHAKAFLYTGNYTSQFTGQAMAVSGSAGDRVDKILLLSGSNAPANMTHAITDAAYTANPANYTDTAFFVSGSVGAVANNVSGSAVFGGDLYVSGVQYFGELRSGIVPANPPDGRIALYGKDDSGVTKLYFRNESGETEVGSGGGGGGSPGGADTELQYNNSTAFGGISGATTDGTSVTFGDSALLVGKDIIHSGDTDTMLRFSTDRIRFIAGLKVMLDMKEDTQDSVMILSGTASSKPGHAPDESGFEDLSLFVSGAIGTAKSSTRGTSLFGGDMVISGALYVSTPGVGQDVIFYGEDSSAIGLQWDADANEHGKLTLGQNDHGVDFQVYGEDSNNYLSWDQSGNFLYLYTPQGEIRTKGDIVFDYSSQGWDFTVNTNNKIGIFVDGSEDKVLVLSGTASTKPGHAPNEVSFTDTNFFVSGSAGSRDTTTAGTALFGGDLVVSGTAHFNRSGEGVGSHVTITSDGKLGIGSDTPAYKLSVGGNMDLGEYLFHKNDVDTFIRYQTDQISIEAGGKNFVEIKEDTQDYVLILSGTASTKPGHAPNEADFEDVNFFVSGSTGSAGSSTKGTTLFGGDVVVSGSITNLGGGAAEFSTTKTFSSLNNNQWYDIDSWSTTKTTSVLYNIAGYPNNTSQNSQYDRFSSELMVVADAANNSTNTPIFTEKRAHIDYNTQNSVSNYMGTTALQFRFTQASNVCTLQVSGSLDFINGCGDGSPDPYPASDSGGALKLKFKRLRTLT